MKSTYGKVAIVAVLLVAIVGVVQLKQRQGATTLPQVTATQDAQASPPSPPVTAVSQTAPSPKTTPAVSSKETPATAPKSVTPPGTAHTPSTGKAPAPVKTAAALPRLLELGSDSCRPCQMMQPVLAALRADYTGKLQVDFIDVWKDTAAGDKYGVQAIPTQIFFDSSGKEIFRHAGYYPKEDILAKFKELGIAL